MYAVAAGIQGARVVSVPLDGASGFAFDRARVLAACDADVKIVFLCSPNNPTGNLLDAVAIEALCVDLAERALVVVDEAYIEFAGRASFAARLDRCANLVVLRTLSKAYSLAGARCGALLASVEIVELLRRIIPPYALPAPTVEAVLELLQPPQLAFARARIETILTERSRLADRLAASRSIVRVLPSDTNFLLVECTDAERVLDRARSARLVVRDVRTHPGLERHVRITIGTPEQNDRLAHALEPDPECVR
jgi:histidinol-phosphate aminotransferase